MATETLKMKFMSTGIFCVRHEELAIALSFCHKQNSVNFQSAIRVSFILDFRRVKIKLKKPSLKILKILVKV